MFTFQHAVMLSANRFWNRLWSPVGRIIGGGVGGIRLRRQGQCEVVLTPNKGINFGPFLSSFMPFLLPLQMH